MKSNDVNDHGMHDHSTGQVKQPWVTPSLEIIGLESAENGRAKKGPDGSGGNFSRAHS